MSNVSSRAPYCICCDEQVGWEDKICIEVSNFKKVHGAVTEVRKFTTDRLYFHRMCFNNSEYGKLLGEDYGGE